MVADARHPSHVSLSHYVPVSGIPHAGGDYVRRHLLAVSRLRPTVAFVSSDRTLQDGLADREPVVPTLVIDRPRWGRSLLARAIRQLGRRWNPSAVGFDVKRSFARSSELRAAVVAAESVEFQFVEECWAIDLARRWNPSARMIAVVHDVVSQRLERQLDTRPAAALTRRVLAVRLAALRRHERRLLDKFDVVTVFSDKDRQLLVEMGVRSPVQVLHLPLIDDEQTAVVRQPEAGNVLFVGAFDRIENSEAAVWLLDEIWPRVLAGRPEASLTLAGANPTADMQGAADRYDRVRITGYVQDLADVYRSASVVAVPLRQGAGVKFKSVLALLWGVPLVATSVGMEGIPAPDGVVIVADDADAFAAGLDRALAGGLGTSAASGRAWARQHYSVDAFERDLRSALGIR